MSDEVKPRVWVTSDVETDHWNRPLGYWCRSSILRYRDIFVPGSEPKPTIDPSEMKTIETIDKVDWNNE